MVDFKTDNGKRGVARVTRTATGYRMYVFNPGNPQVHNLEEDGAELIIGRGVEDETGKPYIEVEFAQIVDDNAKEIAEKLVTEACMDKGFNIKKAKSTHGEENLCFHVAHNRMSEVFMALLNINLPNGQPLIPDHGRNFISEQQQVRHGLEQSLLNAFGQDMYARPQPAKRTKKNTSNLPKSEVNRIARLVDYFRNGIPDMLKHSPKSTS